MRLLIQKTFVSMLGIFATTSATLAQHAHFAALDANDVFPLGTNATAISVDGNVIVGTGASAEPGKLTEAFRWTAPSGLVNLGAMPSGPEFFFAETTPTALTADGAVIVGYGRTANAAIAGRAFRWTPSTGFETLPSCASGGDLRATAISANGNRIAGHLVPGPQPLFWESPNEACNLLGFPNYPNTATVLTTDMDAAGAITVGYLVQSSPARNYAVRWFANGIFEMIGQDRTPVGISADGTTIVSRFARWTASTGWVGIPAAIPGSLFGRNMRAASGDGSLIVGSDSPFLDGPPSAAIWDATNGSRLLIDALENEFGLDLTGWNLQVATDISADGRVIVGTGTDPQGVQRAWRAVLGTPLFAIGDLNCDGIISVSDIGPFVLALTDPAGYTTQFPACDAARADINNDGIVSVSDIGPFVQLLIGE